MKKLITLFTVGIAVLLIAAVTQAKKPVASPGVTDYVGALKSANVSMSGNIGGTQQTIHFIAKNQGRAKNVDATFDNISGYASGVVEFNNEGLYVTFEGPVNFPNFNLLRGNVPCEGAILVDGNVGYDPSTKSVTGTDGSLVEFNGAMDIKGVIKSSNDKATLKGKISASNANLVVFANSSTVSTTPVNLSVKLPAIQLNKK